MRACAHDYSSTARLVVIVQYIGIGNILGMYASTTFDHWQLLGVKVLI